MRGMSYADVWLIIGFLNQTACRCRCVSCVLGVSVDYQLRGGDSVGCECWWQSYQHSLAYTVNGSSLDLMTAQRIRRRLRGSCGSHLHWSASPNCGGLSEDVETTSAR